MHPRPFLVLALVDPERDLGEQALDAVPAVGAREARVEAAVGERGAAERRVVDAPREDRLEAEHVVLACGRALARDRGQALGDAPAEQVARGPVRERRELRRPSDLDLGALGQEAAPGGAPPGPLACGLLAGLLSAAPLLLLTAEEEARVLGGEEPDAHVLRQRPDSPLESPGGVVHALSLALKAARFGRPTVRGPRGVLAALLVVALAAPAVAQGTRGQGDALRGELARGGLRADLQGEVRLDAYVGAARAGELVLRTDLARREDGEPVYRLSDRLDLDLRGVGALHMRVQADLRADLSAVEVVLETEEPRGQGVVLRTRTALARQGERWLRQTTHGSAAPVAEEVADVGPGALVLTPPLGAGDRLARLAPREVGLALTQEAVELETGRRATFRLSVEDRTVARAGGAERPIVVSVRTEGEAPPLAALLDGQTGAPLRLAATRGAVADVLLVTFATPDLAPQVAPPATPVGAVVRLLRACSLGDPAAVRDAVDVPALAGELSRQGTEGAPSRETLEAVLVERLADPAWLDETGLGFLGAVAVPELFASERVADGGARVRVTPRRGGPAFVVAQRDGVWRVVALPRR